MCYQCDHDFDHDVYDDLDALEEARYADLDYDALDDDPDV